MAICSFCGFDVLDGSSSCPHCKTLIKEDQQADYTYQDDQGGCAGVVGFLIPILGLVLYLLLQKSNPGVAKAMGRGALYGIAFAVMMYLIVSYLVG